MLEQNEGARFWLRVMNELRNRGVEDILLAVVDGLKGFPDAITAVFPDAIVQTCIVHLLRGLDGLRLLAGPQRLGDRAEVGPDGFECLNEHLFPSLAAARRIIEAGRTDYNAVRPHSSLGGLAPAGFTSRPRQGHIDTEAKLSAA